MGCYCRVTKSCPNLLWSHGLRPTRLLCPCDSQAEILEWVVIFFSRGSSQLQDQAHISCFGRQILYPCGGGLVAKSYPTLATPWTVAHQAPLSMGFSRQGHWSGLPFPSQGVFPNQESNPGLLHCRQILYQLSYKGSQFYHWTTRNAQQQWGTPVMGISPWSFHCCHGL